MKVKIRRHVLKGYWHTKIKDYHWEYYEYVYYLNHFIRLLIVWLFVTNSSDKWYSTEFNGGRTGTIWYLLWSPNLLIWIPLLISWSLPKLQFLIQSFAPFMSVCLMMNTFCEYISKLTGRASSCWHRRSCDIPTNNKQSTWELHRYRQVSLLSWFSPFHMLVTSRGCMYVFLNFLQLYLSSTMTAGCVRSVKH